MAAKESRGLPESVKQGFKFNRPSAPAPAVHEAEPDLGLGYVVNEVTTAETTQTLEPPKHKGGRPKGVTKVKKTFYLTPGGLTSLQTSQKELVKQADLLIADESEIADLALNLLKLTLEEPHGVEQVLRAHGRMLARADQAS
jgi:hypothetical protein